MAELVAVLLITAILTTATKSGRNLVRSAHKATGWRTPRTAMHHHSGSLGALLGRGVAGTARAGRRAGTRAAVAGARTAKRAGQHATTTAGRRWQARQGTGPGGPGGSGGRRSPAGNGTAPGGSSPGSGTGSTGTAGPGTGPGPAGGTSQTAPATRPGGASPQTPTPAGTGTDPAPASTPTTATAPAGAERSTTGMSTRFAINLEHPTTDGEFLESCVQLGDVLKSLADQIEQLGRRAVGPEPAPVGADPAAPGQRGHHRRRRRRHPGRHRLRERVRRRPRRGRPRHDHHRPGRRLTGPGHGVSRAGSLHARETPSPCSPSDHKGDAMPAEPEVMTNGPLRELAEVRADSGFAWSCRTAASSNGELTEMHQITSGDRDEYDRHMRGHGLKPPKSAYQRWTPWTRPRPVDRVQAQADGPRPARAVGPRGQRPLGGPHLRRGDGHHPRPFRGRHLGRRKRARPAPASSGRWPTPPARGGSSPMTTPCTRCTSSARASVSTLSTARARCTRCPVSPRRPARTSCAPRPSARGASFPVIDSQSASYGGYGAAGTNRIFLVWHSDPHCPRAAGKDRYDPGDRPSGIVYGYQPRRPGRPAPGPSLAGPSGTSPTRWSAGEQPPAACARTAS